MSGNMKVSITTITQLKRNDCLLLLFDIIKNQTFKDIFEWILVEGSQCKEDADANEKLILENIIKKDKTFIVRYIPFTEQLNIGALRNRANDNINANTDIIVWMDDDDYYFNTYVGHCVEVLSNSTCLLAGCSKIYLYDLVLDKNFQLDFTFSKPHHTTNNALAYKSEYLLNHRYNEKVKHAEESSFTNNFTEKMEQMNPDKVMVHLAHSHNTFNKREMIITASLQILKGWNRYHTSLTSKIPNRYLDKYRKYLIDTSPCQYDIIYYPSGHSIIWSPEDMKLGGSEQAIVNLSTNWAKLGKKVAVYGRFEQETQFNGVDYLFSYKFPFEKRLKTVILWRSHGLVMGMYFPLRASTIIVDFHDNFSYTLNNLDKNDLEQMFNRVDKINFKSKYHKDCFEEFMRYKLPNRKYNIILNGVRVEPFLNNTILNDNKPLVRQKYRFCYCSCYTRGLETILEKLWPIIYKNEPRAELHVYYGMEHIHQQDYKHKMLLLLSQPGVMDHGRQPMEMVIREKHLSTFHLYLNTSIAEIDCISIRESLVTGCIPVISNFGVFAERDGLQYSWNPNNDALINDIADDICSKMNDDKFLLESSERLKNAQTIVDWSVIAQKWLDTFIDE